MKTWMLPWMFPVGLLGAVVLVGVFNRAAPLIAVGVGVLLVPVLWRTHFGPQGGADDARYWRFRRP
jgi:hypothetical protein